MSLFGAGRRPDFAEADASESRGRRLLRLVLEILLSASADVNGLARAQVWREKRVMMPADEPESFALDATRVIAYPDQWLHPCSLHPDVTAMFTVERGGLRRSHLSERSTHVCVRHDTISLDSA
jgi:hypothetical protein